MADRSESEGYAAIVEAGKKLGYELRAKQLEVVFKFVRGQDVFVSLPTGSGKSLCYSVLRWTFDRLRKRRRKSWSLSAGRMELLPLRLNLTRIAWCFSCASALVVEAPCSFRRP